MGGIQGHAPPDAGNEGETPLRDYRPMSCL